MYVNNDIDYMKFLKHKRVILFGAGKEGEKAFHKLRQKNIEVAAFCDNDKNKQNRILMGIEVLSVNELVNVNDNDIMIVICSASERLSLIHI